MYTNIEAAKRLVEIYRNLSIDELEENFEYYDNGGDIMNSITGFGSMVSCSLCNVVGQTGSERPKCKNCVWTVEKGVTKPEEACPCYFYYDESYDNIDDAHNAYDLKEALLVRADLLEGVIKLAEQENLKNEN